MRIAILCDIHGNIHAFEAVLARVASQAPDALIIAGDIVVGCPDSDLCWQRALDLDCAILRGNHERYLCELARGQADPAWQDQQFAPARWSCNQLGAEVCCGLIELPMQLRPDEDLLVVHASQRSDRDTVRPYMEADELQRMFYDAPPALVVRGHNHYAQMQLWSGGRIATVGSVGLPMDGNPTAQYALLERAADGWDIHHQSVPYDRAAAVARFYDTGYLAECGPIAELFLRELVSASQQIVPFLNCYEGWKKEENISLDAAFGRYMGSAHNVPWEQCI